MYQQIRNNDTAIKRLEDNAFIPFAEGNSDYREYLKWLDEGNTPLPADPEPVIIPTVVSPYQAKTALLNAGLYDTVNTAVYASNSQQMVIAWTCATEFRRGSVFIQTMGSALGLTEEQIDNLFIAANQVT